MNRIARGLARAALAAILLACAGCSGDKEDAEFAFTEPETKLSYTATVDGAPDEETQGLLEASLAVFRLLDKGAGSIALLERRAESDRAIIGKVLRSRGYYQSEAEIEVTETSPETATVRMSITPGPVFSLADHRLRATGRGEETPPLDAAALGAPIGGPADARGILKAEEAAVDMLRKSGWAYAKRSDRKALADLEAKTITVETLIDAGPRAVFGVVRFEGVETVDKTYLETYRPWEVGDPYRPQDLRAYQRTLNDTALFDTVSVRIPSDPPPGPGPVTLPVTVAAEEGPPRTASAGLRFSTDDGPSARVTYEHRNLLGANEKLRVEVNTGLQEQRLTASFRKPQFRRDGQALIAGAEVRHIEDEAFDETGGTLSLGLERRLTKNWSAGAGGLLEVSEITDNGVQTTALLGGLPVYAIFDDTDDFLDPTEGVRGRADLTPMAGFLDEDPTAFLVADATASTYFRLTEDNKYVLALRGRVGSVISGENSDVPATRRLYSGGGGSVRGYAARSLGPLDGQNDPVGGRSVVEAGAEIRARVWNDIGVAGFVEAGSVSRAVAPDFDRGVQVAAGGGVRYYSPVGPIRVDIGVPLNARPSDDAFQLYLAIGQAF